MKDLEGYLRERSSLVILTFDRNGRVVRANRGAAGVLGDDVVGKTVGDVFVDFAGTLSLPSLAADPDAVHTLTLNSASGFPESRLFTLMERGEEIVAVGEHDSERVQFVQKELVCLNGEMADIARRLARTNAELDRVGRRKNELLGMVAHDLRSPLNVISLYVDILKTELPEPNERHTEYLSRMKDTAMFMARLISDTLDYSSVESGVVKLMVETVDVMRLCRESMDLVRSIAEKKRIRITMADGAPAAVHLECDPRKVRQVMDNLLTNAVKYSEPDGQVTVAVTPNESGVRISVADRGIGIAPDDLTRLFEPFAAFRERGTGGEKSTGLGLAIARKIVEAHGGRISAESEPDTGTIMTFDLPLHAKTG